MAEVIVGEAVAGESAKIKNQIDQIINGVNQSTFTLAELLHKVKAERFYTHWGHETFSTYAKSLDLKVSKSYYLVKIIESMLIAGVPKEVYEPVGIAKLRIIAKLDPLETFEGKPMTTFIKSLTETAKDVSIESLKEAVDHLRGLTGDDSTVWINIAVSKVTRDNVIKPALEKAKMMIGTVAEDEEGKPRDASDSRCFELICAEFLS